MLGCDPEFFFRGQNGQTVGAEKILPEKGIDYNPWNSKKPEEISHIVIDGVQSELNPRPGSCRANLGNEISACFRALDKALKEKGQVGVSFDPVVKVSKAEMDSLSEKSKVFGCAPSTNVYKNAESQITVNPKKYLKRSAGGHIHLGSHGDKITMEALQNVNVMVPILDILVGNTCVLIDRDPSNKERRKNYGRVGEYRLKSYGIEYRTLSNFWLKSYQLMSFVMGMARFAVVLVADTTKEDDYAGALLSAVNRDDIINAIQNNDFALAYSNFLKIEDIICEIAGENHYDYPLDTNTIKAFHWFVKKGINYWSKQDPFQHWINLGEGHGKGWESFLRNRVREETNIATAQCRELEFLLSGIKANRAKTEKELKAQLKALKALEGEAKIKAIKTVVPTVAPVVAATVAPAQPPVAA